SHGLLLELLRVLRSRLLLVQFILPSRHSPGWGYALQNSRATSDLSIYVETIIREGLHKPPHGMLGIDMKP
ncbi:hypothetical protein, partial [Acidovorax sp. SUPP2539]|uniref:hypothetical protein n=1 Tax=Acidovorax sp. SUPP2539 TaxID=2920878 RepID=UPI0024E10F3F